MLVTGSIPTENLPTKSHDVPKKERRTLIRVSEEDMPSSSSVDPSHLSVNISMADLQKHLDEENIHPWEVDTAEHSSIEMELYDGIHSIAKYTVTINSALEFTVFVFHWPIPETHTIYLERKRSLKSRDDVKELLSLVENSCLCQGLPEDDDTKAVVVDPNTAIAVHTPGTIVRHSVPKLLSEIQFESTISFRSPDCQVILQPSSL